jgi:antitoxin component YwqK of YwqJK toxin-antitoxin module
VKEIGYYTDKKLDGQWLRYNEKGDLQTVAFYKDGKKNGVWTFIKPNEILTVEYMNNKVVNTVAIR